MVLQSGQKYFPLFTEDGIIFQPEKKIIPTSGDNTNK